MRKRAVLIAGLATLMGSSLAIAQYNWGPALTSGETGQEVAWSRVHFDPTDGNTVWAATGDLPDPFSGGPLVPANGIHRSTNAGRTWTQMASGALNPDYHILDFTICKANPNVLYVATNEQGVFRTTNGGTSWSAVNNGLTHKGVSMPNPSWGVGAVAVDPTDPSKVYCSIGQLSGLDIFNLSPDHPGFYYSHNGGQSWTGSNDGLPPRQDGILDFVSNTSAPFSLVIPEDSPSTIYASFLQAEANIKVLFGTKATAKTEVYRNTNSGMGTWNALSNGLPNIDQSPVLPGSLARIAASAPVMTIAPAGPNNHVIYLSSVGFGLDIGLSAQQTKSKSRGIFALAPGSSRWIARSNGLPVVTNEVNQNAINTSPVGIHPQDPYTALTGVVSSDDAVPGSSKPWATTTAGDPWMKNWDTGLANSPTLGQAYANALFIEIAPNANKVVAAITWSDPDTSLAKLTDDDGIYMIPAP